MSNIIDAKGLKCPEPIMMLHKAVRESEHGERIEIFATDPSTERDIDKFCEFLGHKLHLSKCIHQIYDRYISK